jgi:hypothetical protein
MERINSPSGNRLKLHEDNIGYLQNVLNHVQDGWWPCGIDTPNNGAVPGNRFGSPSSCSALNWVFKNHSIMQAMAGRYGVPPELVAGLLAAEIDLDNTWYGISLDNMVRQAYKTLDTGVTGLESWAAQHLIDMFTDTNSSWGDRVAGYSNVHHSTYVKVEEYMTNCGQPLPYGINKRNYLPPLLTDQGTIEFTARMARYLADIRTGHKNSHYTDLDLVDMAQMWGAWRNGIGGVTCEGNCGFNNVKDFQDKQSLGPQAELGYPFFSYF